MPFREPFQECPSGANQNIRDWKVVDNEEMEGSKLLVDKGDSWSVPLGVTG